MKQYNDTLDGIMAPIITPLSLMTHSIITHCTMTQSIMRLKIKSFSITALRIVK
jgi:hypothetical protein